MKYSKESYKDYVNEMFNVFSGSNLLPAVSINSETILFPVEGDNAYIVFSLNRQNPLFYTIRLKNFKFNQLPTHFSRKLFTEVGISYLDDVEFIKEANTVTFEIVSRDMIKDETPFRLYFEMFTLKPNLYLCDKDDIIIETFYNGEKKVGEKFTLDLTEIKDSSKDLTTDVLSASFVKELTIRREEKYKDTLTIVRNRIRITERKIKNIQKDVEEAKLALTKTDLANEILSMGLNLRDHVDSIELSTTTLSLDKKLTIYENVDKLFKASKKAKETIRRSEKNIEDARDENKLFTNILDMIFAAPEEDVDKFVLQSGLDKKHHQITQSVANSPYKINLNGTIILFGRNAVQNDYLSFGMKLDRDFTWMHIKDYSGAHIVIKNKKPTEAELLFAAELALIQSKKTAGEVIYTHKKNVRKGHTLGEAILKNYSTIKLNNVRKETIEKIKNSSEQLEFDIKI